MADTDAAAGWRVPCDALHYLVLAAILTTLLAALYSIDVGPGGQGRLPSTIWGLLTALGITFGAWLDDRPIRTAVLGRSDDERQAVRQSLRNGVLPPDASSDAYVEWTIQVIRHTWHLRRQVLPWLTTLVACGGLVIALISGEALWLLVATVTAGLALLTRWDLAQMDACFAGLERQITDRVPA